MDHQASVGVGDEVRALRKKIDITQEELARRAGMQRVDVVRIERGHVKATKADTRRALARGFGVPFEAFDDYLRGERSIGDVLALRLKGAA